METLRGSSSKLFSDKYRDRAGLSSPRAVLRRLEIRFLPSPKHVTVGFSHSISISLHKHKMIQPILASSNSSSDLQISLQNEETQILDQTETVHVKFQLQKECLFGEQFHIVGDDPMFGSWDPSSAIPLDWSDGHVWTVELDIPIGKSIRFKFLLKGISGNLMWQPGTDRILKTWETKNTITVSEDWYDAELQKIIEEGLTSNQNEENLTQPRGVQKADVNRESTTADSITNPTEKPLAEKPMAIVAENITDPKEKPQVNTNKKVFGARNIAYAKEEHVAISNKDMFTGENSFGNNGRAVTVKNLASSKDEENLASYEGGPVLVPGLTPSPMANNEEASPVEVKKNIVADASVGADKVKEHNVPELDLKGEPDHDSPHPKETTEVMLNDQEELNGREQVEKPQLAKEQGQPNSKLFENHVVENDIQWGRKTLQKLLTNLGFL